MLQSVYSTIRWHWFRQWHFVLSPRKRQLHESLLALRLFLKNTDPLHLIRQWHFVLSPCKRQLHESLLALRLFLKNADPSAHDDVIQWKHFPRYWPYVGNSPVTGEFLAQRPVTRSFDVFFDLHLTKLLSKQPWGWWFETPSRPLWRHCNVIFAVHSYKYQFYKNSIDHEHMAVLWQNELIRILIDIAHGSFWV